MSKMLSKYIASFDYFGKSLIVSSVTTDSIYIAAFMFPTIFGAPAGIPRANFSLAFSVYTGIVKRLLKTTRKKKKKHNKIVTLARSKLKSIGSKLSEALINNEISHEDFMTIIDKERNYRELRESIRMINTQRNGTEKINLVEEG